MALSADPAARFAAIQYRREARRLRLGANRADSVGWPVHADYLRALAVLCVKAAENEIRDAKVRQCAVSRV